MAELTAAETTVDSCCAPEAQAACCEPSAKTECCDPSHGEGCDCAAGEFIQALADAGLAEVEIRETHRVHAHAASAIVRARKPGMNASYGVWFLRHAVAEKPMRSRTVPLQHLVRASGVPWRFLP